MSVSCIILIEILLGYSFLYELIVIHFGLYLRKLIQATANERQHCA